MTGFTTLSAFAIMLTVRGFVAHGFADLTKWGHSTIPHPSRIGVNEHFSRDLLRQGHGEDARPREEVRAPSEVLVFRRHYLTIPMELLYQEGVIPLCRIMVNVHHGVRPVRGGHVAFNVLKHNRPLTNKALFIRGIFEGKPDKAPRHELNSRQFAKVYNFLQKRQDPRLFVRDNGRGHMNNTGVRTKEHHIGIEKKEKRNEQQNKEKSPKQGPNGWPRGPIPPKKILRD